MSFELVKIIRETLGSLSTIAESIEASVESIKRTSGLVSSSLDNRKLRKMADALAKFYFTPVGVRMDIANYINNPTQDNHMALENRLEENREIIKNFSEYVYDDIDSKLFDLPLNNINYLFGMKSKLHLSIYNSRYEIENLSKKDKKKYLKKIAKSFDEFNNKLEETVKNLKKSAV